MVKFCINISVYSIIITISGYIPFHGYGYLSTSNRFDLRFSLLSFLRNRMSSKIAWYYKFYWISVTKYTWQSQPCFVFVVIFFFSKCNSYYILILTKRYKDERDNNFCSKTKWKFDFYIITITICWLHNMLRFLIFINK